jgi:hypothetical protein
MEDIAQKIGDKDYRGLIDTCEALEFEVLPMAMFLSFAPARLTILSQIAAFPHDSVPIAHVYSTLLACYLIINDL